MSKATARTTRRTMFFCDNCLAAIWLHGPSIMKGEPVACADCEHADLPMSDEEYKAAKAAEAPPARTQRNIARLHAAHAAK